MQAELMFSLLYLLGDAGQIQDVVPASVWPDLECIDWGFFELDARGAPRRGLGGLHESVLETDPTGREMRPRTTEPSASGHQERDR
jgi:hypothetical protein